jgi:NAD(P)-dependent dehydrogenase (short-subunit alcohol dehydrogenase family)
MAKVIAICGYGPGISHAVALRFGAAGFAVALVGRRDESVTKGAAALEKAGIRARGFVCDLGQPSAVLQLTAEVRAVLGPIHVLHWNAYAAVARDLTTCSVEELQYALNVGVVGLNTAVRASLDDLRTQPQSAVLVTGGSLSREDPAMVALAVKFGAGGLAVVKAAQHKLVNVLHEQLKSAGIFVGEVMVAGIVKGTLADRDGRATLEPAHIAETFWELYQTRAAITVVVPS